MLNKVCETPARLKSNYVRASPATNQNVCLKTYASTVEHLRGSLDLASVVEEFANFLEPMGSTWPTTLEGLAPFESMYCFSSPPTQLKVGLKEV